MGKAPTALSGKEGLKSSLKKGAVITLPGTLKKKVSTKHPRGGGGGGGRAP